MAIARVKKVTLIAPLRIKQKFIDKLYQLQVIHVIDSFSKNHEKEIKRIEGKKTDTSEGNISKLDFIKSTFDLFVKRKKGLFESFFPLPLQVKESKFNTVLKTFRITDLFAECKNINSEYHSISNRILETKLELNNLSLFLEIPYSTNDLQKMQNVSTEICIISNSKLNELSQNNKVNKIITWQVFFTSKKKIKIIIFYLKKEKDDVKKLFKKYNIETIPTPTLAGNISDRINSLKKELSNLNQKMTELEASVFKLYKHYEEVEILLSYWENEGDRFRIEKNFVSSKRLLIISGYIKEKDIKEFENILNNEFREISSIYEDPDPKANIPVCITLNRFFRPIQLLTNMFGLPTYFSFDPTPFISLGFLLFFGICFGDVVYGLMLMGLSFFMINRYKTHENVKNFFSLFFYAGISTTIIGVLTGGWAGDIYSAKYFGEDNFLLGLRNTLMVIDPLARPIIALVFAIGLGIINQFYGISLRMYGELRKGNIVNAILDCTLWLFFLPGIIIITMPLFIKIPEWIFNTGLYLAAISAIGLVITQGRNEKTWIGKIMTGFVSMYGILGTYGSVSFLSDILSYSRLLALGLTTSIIAMTFNIIANIARSIDIIGIVVFILVLILGHTFNFIICIISSFVHPARLIFLEFFGRFYQGGAIKFIPYGFSSKRVQLIMFNQEINKQWTS